MKIKLLAITANAEGLIEYAARICYQSAQRRQPGSAAKLIRHLISLGHESPLEHAYATFHLAGCSRAMTHQLVRHRLISVSQLSQRYVAKSNFGYVIPPTIAKKDQRRYRQDMQIIQAMYNKWQERGLKREDARFVLPNACETEIIISANFREFRHIFEVRCTRQAQWEIRQACCQMLKILHRKAPHVFEDLLLLIKQPTAPNKAGVNRSKKQADL